jgi:hypothetical protein
MRRVRPSQSPRRKSIACTRQSSDRRQRSVGIKSRRNVIPSRQRMAAIERRDGAVEMRRRGSGVQRRGSQGDVVYVERQFDCRDANCRYGLPCRWIGRRRLEDQTHKSRFCGRPRDMDYWIRAGFRADRRKRGSMLARGMQKEENPV